MISGNNESAKTSAGVKTYDNNPSFKRRKKYQQQLNKLIKANESGELKKLGRAAIKRFVQCGDSRAAALQIELVELGLAEMQGNTVTWSKAA